MKAALYRDDAVSRSAFLALAFAMGPLGIAVLASLASLGVISLPNLRIGFFTLALGLVVAPIVEELAFRGAIQEYLSSQGWAQKHYLGLSVPNILTSLLFASCHLPTHALALAVLTFFPSLVFGKIKEATGSLRWSMALHAWFNMCFIGLIWCIGEAWTGH